LAGKDMAEAVARLPVQSQKTLRLHPSSGIMETNRSLCPEKSGTEYRSGSEFTVSASPNPEKISILTVDDHPLLRGGIAALLAGQEDLSLAGEAANGREAIEKFRRLKPDITLMDVQMPDMDGIDAIIAIRSEFPAARIIVLTTYEGDALALRALKAGAQAYVLKSHVRKDLLETIRLVHGGAKRVDPRIAEQIALRVEDDALSEREVKVLALIAAGNSNKEIAAQLSISEETAKTHVRNILAKLGVQDRTHAVTLALRRGIIRLPSK
jgi:DNA-binding NarL/FixJ family response regulator